MTCDLLHETGGTSTALFDMGAGMAVPNVVGVGDPDVHEIDGRWTMFLGAFTTSLRIRVLEARLPEGDELDSDRWSLVTRPGGHLARPVFSPPWRGAWDSQGTHTPSWVRGRAGGSPVERIYYAGRMTAAHGGPRSRYAIGVAERRGDAWVRHDGPVLTGTEPRRSVLEPLVRFEDGVWRMWFQAAPFEVGRRGDQPDYQLCLTESRDGLTGWSPPEVVAGPEHGFFDNAVRDGEMVLARGSNLYGTEPYPPQGLWWTPRDRLRPVRLVDTDHDPPHWARSGTFGPEMHWGRRPQDADTLYVFSGGTSPADPWPRRALQRLRERRLPPFPSPFLLSIGRFTLPDARRHLVGC